MIQTILQNGSLASCVTAADGPVCAVNIIVHTNHAEEGKGRPQENISPPIQHLHRHTHYLHSEGQGQSL